jgi:cell division protein FtsB
MASSSSLLKTIIPAPLRNKYFLTGTVFLFWLLLFDNHNIFEQFRLQRSIHQLRSDKERFEHKIVEAKREGELLRKNGEAIAREKYFMSKKGEDVFILSEE